MPVRRPLFALVAAAAVVASGLVTGGAASAAPGIDPAPGGYTPPPIAWTSCPAVNEYPANFQCGTVTVPLDWNDVGGAKITLAVTRVKHTTKRYQGVLLVNPGGPGGSGTIYAYLKDSVPKGGGDSYDWIGFDPRGVGESKPSLTCDTDYFAGPRPAYVPSTKSSRAGLDREVEGVRGGLRQEERPAAGAHDHRGLGEGHGRDPRRARPGADQLPRVLLRHDARADVRDAVPDAPAPCDLRQQHGPAEELSTTRASTRTSPSRRCSASSRRGWRSTTRRTTWARRSPRSSPR